MEPGLRGASEVEVSPGDRGEVPDISGSRGLGHWTGLTPHSWLASPCLIRNAEVITKD